MDLNERLTYLGEILIALTGSPVPSQQFQTLADQAHVVIPCDYLAVCLIDPDGQGYVVHSLAGTAAGAIPQRLFSGDEGVVGRVLQRNRAVMVDDVTAVAADHPEIKPIPDLEGILGRFDLQALLAAPLRQGDQVLGALLFAAEAPSRYNDDDFQIGKLMAAGLSAALENTRLYQNLADERSTLAAVLGSTQDAVLVVNGEGRVLLANPAVQTMLKLDPAAITGERLLDSVTDPRLRELFTDPQPDLVEIALPDDGGAAQASLAPVVSDYGESIGWAAVFRDITLFKELEQMKNEFVNTVSHDLKNPITSIKMGAELLERTGSLSAEQHEMQQRILRTADYMNELVSDLLDLGKIEAGINMDRASLDLAQLAANAAEQVRANARDKEQTLTVSASARPSILGDRGRLLQVFLNLIGNAIKYTPRGGEIEVTVGAEEDQATVVISDTGIGIPAKDLPYVFDKFYRVKGEKTKQIQGTGLGLAITKSVVEAHEGRISVESAPDAGSAFTITLPIEK